MPSKPLVEAFQKAIASRNAMPDHRSDLYQESAWTRLDLQKALLAALYHSQGPTVVPLLLPLAAIEKEAKSYDSPIADAIVSFGPEALPYVEGRAVESYSEVVKRTATALAYRIGKGEKGEVPRKGERGRPEIEEENLR